MAKKVLTPAEVEIKMIKKQYRKEKLRSIGTVALAVAVAISAIAIGKTAAADKAGSDNVTVTDTNNNSQQSVQNNNSSTNNTQTQNPSDGVDVTPDKDLSNDNIAFLKNYLIKTTTEECEILLSDVFESLRLLKKLFSVLTMKM